MTQFRYEPLCLDPQKDQIRVIELLPGNDTSPIQCNILEASLAKPPAYEALSYRWGEEKSVPHIFVHGNNFEVTANLYSALWHLRDEKQKRLLWVDAICIDQTNIEEKNHQVQLMRNIYKKASRALIWLGQDTPEIFRGLSIVPILMRAYKERWTYRDCVSKWEIVSNLSSLWALMDNPYFTRIWVVQEVATSTDRLVVCGKLTVSWRDLSVALGYSRETGVGHPLETPNTVHFWSINTSLLDTATHVDAGLLQLLLRHRTFAATDPRDKVYALLGLTTTASYQGRHLHIAADYNTNISAEEVFNSTAQRIIKTCQNLDIFSVPRATSSALGKLPSWVPDWTAQEQTTSLLLPDREDVDQSYFSAALPSSQANPRLQAFGPALGLGLCGQLIDSVEEVGELFLKPPPMSASQVSIGKIHFFKSMTPFYHCRAMNCLTLLNWERITGADSGQPYPTGEEINDVYWQTFLAGSLHSDPGTDWKKERLSWQTIYQGYDYPCYLGLHYFTNLYIISMFIIEFYKALHIFLALWGQFGIYKPGREASPFGKVSLSPVHENRRMFRTADGYIGLGPRDMRSGDRIALFSGGKMPLVMRESGTGLELVGDCYVHGIMHGEGYHEDQCELIWIV